MRFIGEVGSTDDGMILRAYLLQNGIETKIETERNGRVSVWVIDEDRIGQAAELFNSFNVQSDKSVYREAVFHAKVMEQAKKEEQDRYERNLHNVRPQLNNRGSTVVTSTLIGICVAIWVFEILSPNMIRLLQGLLMISDPYQPGITLVDELMKGQIWRLFTPALLHFPLMEGGQFQIMGIMHILFNMMWLKQLGSVIEARHGSRYMILMFLVFSALPNLLQYSLSGPAFLGMSGVNYALLCFLWIRGKFDRRYGMRLNPGVIWLMMIWFVFGFTGNGTANMVHLGGVVCGIAWGYISSGHWKKA